MNPSDMTLLLTRPEAAARRFLAQVEDALGPFGATILSPVLDVVALAPFPYVSTDAEVVFTSENAVRLAAPHLADKDRRVWCVGERTAEVARQAGLRPRVGDGDAAALAEMLISERLKAPILHLSGRHQAGDLVERLTGAGLRARRILIYEQVPLELSHLALDAFRTTTPLMLPLFSPRSAMHLQAGLPGLIRAPLLVVGLSQAVSSVWTGPCASAATASHPDARSMLDAMAQVIDAFSDA